MFDEWPDQVDVILTLWIARVEVCALFLFKRRIFSRVIMSPLNKIISLFQPNSKSNRKNLLVHQKIFSSELNIRSEVEDLKHKWGTLNGYCSAKGRVV